MLDQDLFSAVIPSDAKTCIARRFVRCFFFFFLLLFAGFWCLDAQKIRSIPKEVEFLGQSIDHCLTFVRQRLGCNDFAEKAPLCFEGKDDDTPKYDECVPFDRTRLSGITQDLSFLRVRTRFFKRERWRLD